MKPHATLSLWRRKTKAKKSLSSLNGITIFKSPS